MTTVEKDDPQTDKLKTLASNRLLGALFLGGDAVLSRLLPRRPHILIACMPKSGSTFLATALSELPGLRRCRLTPAWGQREQELCQIRLSRYNHEGYIAQHHLRNSEWTQHLIKKYRLTPVVQVRNLADCVISLRDHMRGVTNLSPLSHLTPEHLKLPDAQLEEAMVHLALPWYISFYRSWRADKNALIINYDDLSANPAAVIQTVTAHAGLSFTQQDITAALDRCKSRETRFNVGGPGRGRDMSPQAAAALAQLIDLYPDMKEDPVFRI
jgi:hypothetical protein